MGPKGRAGWTPLQKVLGGVALLVWVPLALAIAFFAAFLVAVIVVR
jgi:hypothetical protein